VVGRRRRGEIVRRRRLSGVVARPLNFTVRGRNKNRLEAEPPRVRSRRQDPSFGACACARGQAVRATPAFVAALCGGSASGRPSQGPLRNQLRFALKIPRAHSSFDEGVL
jgi:hypothetical protein